MKTPIYSTKTDHVGKRPRRRIGTMPTYLKKELEAMSTTERARIAVGMAMVTLLNQ